MLYSHAAFGQVDRLSAGVGQSPVMWRVDSWRRAAATHQALERRFAAAEIVAL